ncbi:MAG: OmpA family protein [Paludibacteraceae bacterium]|nr:OmpA family protein [Paludibacteraceae bacterium]
MRMRKGLILLGLLTLPSLVSHAQTYDHYLDLTVGGGLHSVQFSPKEGNFTPGTGMEVRAAYRRVLDEHWSAGLGLGVSWYNARSFYEDYRISRAAVDAQNGEPYEYRVIFSDWREKQHVVNLELPVAIYYQQPISTLWSFLGSGGLKFFMPISNQYRILDGEMETKGYFKQLTNIEYGNLPQHGFFKEDAYEGEASLRKFGGGVFADAGFLRSFKHGDMSLYMGLYFSYGFTDLSKDHTSSLFDGNSYPGVLSSNLTDKAHLMAAGVKVGISFGMPRIFPLPEMQHELAMEDEDTENIEAEIRRSETAEVEEVLRIARQLAQQEEERKARELANVKEVVKWLNNNVQVEFKLGEAIVQMNEEIEAYINDLTNYIKNTPGRKILIWGHTCNLGKESKNIELGMQRAEAMRKLLIKAGCPINRVMARSKGSSDPLVPNTSEANRQKNRRIEIVMK